MYNALFVHAGDHVLYRLPDWPLIGGPITLEAFLDGLANSLTLVALLALFLTLNAILPASELLKMTPMALRDIGAVVLIAFTYIPETRRHLIRIREAQAIRGHEMHGFRDWQPVIVPLLIGGLERSMQIAESMVARGYGSVSDRSSSKREKLLLVACLSTTLVGWLFALWTGWPGWLLLLLSLVGLLVIMWRRGKHSSRTSLRPNLWTPADGLIIAAAGLALIIIVGISVVEPTSLVWNPYPSVSLPDFDWRIGLAILLLAGPAVIVSAKIEPERDYSI
jgi:energy-coupling factor transport system permease protein